MRAQNKESHHFRVVLLEHFTDGEEIAQRLGHLLVVHAHKAVMHPVIDVTALMRALGLRNLVLMMRKLQVGTAAVHIEMLAQQFGTHSRTFDMPTGATFAPF